MATGRTENLGLCLWQLSDAVKMSDFNDDNQKIDDAVTAARQEAAAELAAYKQTVNASISSLNAAVAAAQAANLWVKIADQTFPSAAATMTVGVSGAASTYFMLRVCVISPNLETGISFQVNGITSTSYHDGSSSQYSFFDDGSYAEIDLRSAELRIRGAKTHWKVTGLSPSALSTINMKSRLSSQLPAGTRVVVWGLKA